MFRLVQYDEEKSKQKDWIYLCRAAGHTIAEELRFVYDPDYGEDSMTGIVLSHFPPGFFQGFAAYVGMEDDIKAGIQFIMRKASRMIEKMEDPLLPSDM